MSLLPITPREISYLAASNIVHAQHLALPGDIVPQVASLRQYKPSSPKEEASKAEEVEK